VGCLCVTASTAQLCPLEGDADGLLTMLLKPPIPQQPVCTFRELRGNARPACTPFSGCCTNEVAQFAGICGKAALLPLAIEQLAINGASDQRPATGSGEKVSREPGHHVQIRKHAHTASSEPNR